MLRVPSACECTSGGPADTEGDHSLSRTLSVGVLEGPQVAHETSVYGRTPSILPFGVDSISKMVIPISFRATIQNKLL